jgi:hypothetical protein
MRHDVSSCDKRTCYTLPYLQLVLTAGADTVTIDFPDNVLLHIFHFVRVKYLDTKCLHRTRLPSGVAIYHYGYNVRWCLAWWHPFVHVCQKWRYIIFASPRFLNLRLVYVPRTRVELIGIWPPFPIIITNNDVSLVPEDHNFDAATVHHNRVREIDLYLTSSQLQRFASAMQEQFPALIHLNLKLAGSPAQILPDGFLVGSAPCLQSLTLRCVPFPGLPELLLCATDLVSLTLENIPHTGYISPEAFVTALAVLANLKALTIQFGSPLSRPDQRSRPPPPTRTVLPALTRFMFQGVGEYLEDFVARIDAPLLDSMRVIFHPSQVTSDTPELALFMRRSETLMAPDEAHDHSGISVNFPPTDRGL